ncbi:ArsA family ATPase [Thermoleptolyngbya sp. M55_K2018_002]|uniref:ArsA family ATPase n=1 Tax=Thermoleptolyngbya sp. M55_K2018_002 TaxID=2747808 RepID=UPI0019F13483|nr:ArsA family ATPase [Thermoleptolyngbya sp. M55_K2018_002]HIK41059.1 ArsA family ATPase [Thermoleptolyngbya sp. M55_K2018_002]
MYPFDSVHLLMVSGKGGVGKTTLSCAIARRWGHEFPQERVLLISTDPAHSLGDVLLTEVTDEARSLADLPNVQTRALDAAALLTEFKARYGSVLELLVERGSFVEGADLSPVWDLGFPGLDELMSLLEIQRILEDGESDRIVVDMAPSGHTLNLFGLMDFLDQFLAALSLFQEKHRVMQQTFAGTHAADAADEFLAEMQTRLAHGRALLQDATRTACLAVAIPEPMSYQETRRFLESLDTLHIPIGGIVVNRVLSDSQPSEGDSRSDPYGNRLCEQADLLEKFAALCPDPLLLILPQQPTEPVGLEALDRLLPQLLPHTLAPLPPIPPPVAPSTLHPIPPSLPDFLDLHRRLLIIGGKGGVGKTTLSGAIAQGMARRHPQQRVRVISIDPAHSLGDAFGTVLGHDPTPLLPNLSAQEIDADTLLHQFREDYLWELAEMMSGDTGDDALQIAYGPQAWRQIVSQALPGIDEMLALIAVIDLLEDGSQDLVILDTAPTGHLLRFLEMPTALNDWLGWIFKLWLKYQDVVGRVDLMSRLRTLRQRVVKAQKLLKDPSFTEFIGVAQNQSAILAEAARLTDSLRALGIQQTYLVHNRYVPGQEIPAAQFPGQTIVRLASLPRGIPPQELIQLAATLLFEPLP